MAASAVLLAALACSCREHRTGGPSVLIFILDSVRADHLGCYGYPRETSPVIDSLAAAGTIFLEAQSQACWTLPSVATVLTGLTPQTTGVSEREGVLYGLDGTVPFLPELMEDAGYHSFAEMCIPWLGPDFGFDRGFDEFICHTDRALEGHLPESAVHLADWLRPIPAGERYFAVIHVFEAHNPFDPSPPWDTVFVDDMSTSWRGISNFSLDSSGRAMFPDQAPYLLSQYDGEIRMIDEGIGAVMDSLRALGRDRETIVVILADHGEEFLERGGNDHGHTMFQEMLHVPLIFSGRGIPQGSRRIEVVGLLDVTPTLLSAARVPVPQVVEGLDLFAGELPDRAMPSGHTMEGTRYCVRQGDMKLVLDTAGSSLTLYDLASDPEELRPLPPDSSLGDSLMRYLSRRPIGASGVTPDSDATETLRGLGYI